MDSSLLSTLYLIPDWLMRLLEDYDNEVATVNSCSLKLLEEKGRKAVWNICSVLGVDSNGVPGQACQLLERYLHSHMHEFIRPGVIDLENWQEYKRSMALRIPLLMASCVQLAAKMSSVGVQVNATLVRTCLLCKGVVVSVPDIIRSEFQVYSTLGFRVPLWTSFEIAQMLALESGLSASVMKAAGYIVNIAEYRRVAIAASVRDIANVSKIPSFSAGTLSTLHLAAGAVAASTRYLASPTLDPVPRLAALTRAPPLYVKCVCDVILAEVLVDDSDVLDRQSINRKRKRNT